MLFSRLQPRQSLRQELVAIAAQRLDGNQGADHGDDPVTPIAGRVLQKFDIVGGEGEGSSPGIGARLVAEGRPATVDAARQRRLLVLDVGLAPCRHLGAMRDDRPGDAPGEVGLANSRRWNDLAVVGRKHRLEHEVLADPLGGGEDQRIVGLGAGMERAIECLHHVLRPDQRQVVRRVRLDVGAAIGRKPAVEAGDAVPVRQRVNPVFKLIEDAGIGHRVNGGPARSHRTGAKIISLDEIVAEFGDVGVAQGPVANRRQLRRLPPLRQAPRRLAGHLDPVAEGVPGEASLEARLVSQCQRYVGDVTTIAAAGARPGRLQAAAPVERVGVKQWCCGDQFSKERVGVRLFWCPL